MSDTPTCAAMVTHRWGWGYMRRCLRPAKTNGYCAYHAKRLAEGVEGEG